MQLFLAVLDCFAALAMTISGHVPDLILRSIAQAMRLEGWPQMTAVQAAILRDARRRYASSGCSSDNGEAVARG
jgi:hypothetical protein